MLTAMISCMCHTQKLMKITMCGHVTKSYFQKAVVLPLCAGKRSETNGHLALVSSLAFK